MSGIGVTGGCQLLDVGLGAELGSSEGAEITLTLEPSLQPSVVLFTTPGGDANLGEQGLRMGPKGQSHAGANFFQNIRQFVPWWLRKAT